MFWSDPDFEKGLTRIRISEISDPDPGISPKRKTLRVTLSDGILILVSWLVETGSGFFRGSDPGFFLRGSDPVELHPDPQPCPVEVGKGNSILQLFPPFNFGERYL